MVSLVDLMGGWLSGETAVQREPHVFHYSAGFSRLIQLVVSGFQEWKHTRHLEVSACTDATSFPPH